jgi:hypothetical protein
MSLYSSASRFNGFLSESVETLIMEPSAGDTSLKRGVNKKSSQGCWQWIEPI